MYRTFEQRMRATAQELRDEAKRRKEITPSDVSAEAFEYSAQKIDSSLNEVMAATERLTPEQWGELHNVSAVSVRKWLRNGELEGELTPNGWLIARDAQRIERRKQAS